MDPLSSPPDYDSDDTLRGPRTAPLTAPLTAKHEPPTPLAHFQSSGYTPSSIEILSPTFSSSESGSEPSSPIAFAYRTPLPWYRRIFTSFWSLFTSIKSFIFRQPPPTHHKLKSSTPSAQPSPTSSTSSGFNSPSMLKAAPAPPPILVPPPPKDLHLSEYFPLLSPRVSGLWKRRRTSSTPKSSPHSLNAQFSPSTSPEAKNLLSPQAANWPPPLESPAGTGGGQGAYSDEEEDGREGEYVTIGKVVSPTDLR